MNQLNEINEQEALQVGRSVLLVGIRRAMALLQAQAEILETQLKSPPAAENGDGEIRPAMQRTMALIEEAPPVKKRKTAGVKAYWAQFTPEERVKEVRRRMRLAQRRKAAMA